MQIGVPAETTAGETRVAVTPETTKKLVAQGHTLLVASGAGQAASAIDAAYVAAGAQITDQVEALGCDLIQDNSWQEEAARLLLHSGFRPCNTIGYVEHLSNAHPAGRKGRTLGSVWRVMRNLVESERERSTSKAQDLVGGEPLSKSGIVCVGSRFAK